MASDAAIDISLDEQVNNLTPAHRNVTLFAMMLSATLNSTTILIVSTNLPQFQAAMISYLNAFGMYTLVSAAAIPLILLVSKAQNKA